MLAPPAPAVREGAAEETDPATPRPGAAGRLRGILATLLGSALVLVFVLAIFVAVVTRTSSRGVPTILGVRPFVVLSGSMTPTFSPGDLIVDRAVTPAQASHLRRGQVITFEPGTGSLAPYAIITHRIYRVGRRVNPANGSTSTVYETKGDANSAPDGDAIAPAQVLGVYQFRIPYAGYLLNGLHQPAVFILVVSLPFAALVVVEARRRWTAPGAGGGKKG